MYINPYMYFRVTNKKKPLSETLELIKKAIESKKNFQPFYKFLVSSAPTREERDILLSIWDDKLKHHKMFLKIYKDFTGIELEDEPENEFEGPESYIINIKRGLFEGLKDVERDRKIREGLPQVYYRDMLFEMITDEFKHANEYNYILNQNLFNLIESISMEKAQNKEWMKFIKKLVKRSMREEMKDEQL